MSGINYFPLIVNGHLLKLINISQQNIRSKYNGTQPKEVHSPYKLDAMAKKELRIRESRLGSLKGYCLSRGKLIIMTNFN